jgi:predicted nicotinamide N-methyase
MSAATAVDDASGALGWIKQCTRADGAMRAWVELDELTNQPMIWTVSLLLLHHLETESVPGAWRGRHILELGSGAGHLAVGMARLGAHVVATESGRFPTYAAMQDSIRYLLKQHDGGGTEEGEPRLVGESVPLAAGGRSNGTVAFRELHWGIDDIPPAVWSGFDTLLLSEIVYDPDLHEALLGALRHILQPGMVAYSIFADRPFSLNFMALLYDDGSFEVEEIKLKDLFGMEDDVDVYTHTITRKQQP